MPNLIDTLQAHPDLADSLIRAACGRLRTWQAAAGPTISDTKPHDDARLATGLARLAPNQAQALLAVLDRDASLPAQRPVLDTLPPAEDEPPALAKRLGPVTDDLALLLRPPQLAWDEAQEIDWAVRHWEASRQAGLLDEELAGDFGEFWRRLEWSALRHHLRLLAEGSEHERRLLAHVVKTSTRYVALAPLKRALEARHPEYFDQAFSLR